MTKAYCMINAHLVNDLLFSHLKGSCQLLAKVCARSTG